MPNGKRLAALISASLFAITGFLAVAQPASAAPTCPYPYVCFYATADLQNPNNYITGKFQDVTTSWQWLSASKGSDLVVNTRNDDVAYMHMTDGTVYCVENNSSRSFENDEPIRYVDAIRISSSSSC